MYLPGSDQCNMPNSESPMPQAWIDRENEFINSVGSAFTNGDSTLNALITALGGNPSGPTAPGASGVPTTGTLDLDAAGVPVVASDAGATQILSVTTPASLEWPSSPQIVSGGLSPQGRFQRNRRYRNIKRGAPQSAYQNPPAHCPIVVPLVTAIPVPEVAAAAPSAPAPAPAPAAPANCMTGNFCLDLRNGCVLSSQVSPEQLQICSAAGYAGNLNLFPAIAAAGGADGGEYFGTPEPNPPPYTPGMSGFGQDDSAVQAANAGVFGNVLESIITAAATAAALAILWKQKRK